MAVGDVHAGAALVSNIHLQGTYITIAEITAPVAPGPSKGRLYTVDDGAGKTDLEIRFNQGVAQVIASEP